MWKWIFRILIVIFLALLFAPVFATGSNDDSDSDGTTIGDTNANADAGAESSSDATGGNATGGTATGSATVNTSSENTSLVLTGARDTAPCFTKITIGAEGFGIGFSRSDAFCKKVRLISRQIESRNFDAAARLECTLKEWKEVYGKDKDACYWAILIEELPAPEPVIAAPVEITQSGGVLMADISEEKYDRDQAEADAAVKEILAQLARQQAQLRAQKREVEQALRERDERLATEQLRKDDFRSRYEQRVEQETENDGEPEK